jgi:protein involved in polysaccharide export with SLBB domain
MTARSVRSIPSPASRRVRAPAARALALLLALLALALPLERAAAQSASGDPAAPAAGAAAAAVIVPILPGDVVRVKIWREPDLSGDFTVDEAGAVVLPKLGARQVGGMRPESARAALAREYIGFLNHSSVEITLLRRVQVTGAVRNPGLYPVDGTMTIADALALAGGVTGAGKQDRVQLLRYGEKVPGNLSGRTRIADAQLRSGDQLYVPERSWISRNPGFIVGAVGAVAALVRITTN